MSGIGNMGKQAMRVAKNYTKGYSDTQTKVRAATSNDPWGPSGTQMNEISTLTFNQQDFIEIMEMMDKRLNDKGKNWRHVFKTLTLLDYLLHAGSENVVLYFRENLYVIKTLKEFQYIDEYGKDQGANVRQKAKDISNLLMDEARLRDERRSRAHMRDRMSGRQRTEDDDMPRRAKSVPPPRQNNEDTELQRALELSRLSAAEEADRLKKKTGTDAELEEAMRLSREEEARRLKNQEDSTANALFDDGYDLHNNNQYSLVDTSVPYQQTGIQPQFASFNPYAAQQQQQHEEYMRQQQQMEMQRQQMEQQQQQMEQQAQYEAMMQQQAYMQQQQIMAQQTAQPIQPQMTSYGSNNPFAQFSAPPPMPSQPAPPQRAPSAPPSMFNFNDYASLNTSTITPPPLPAQTTANAAAFRTKPQAQPKDDGQHAKLAALLGAGGGVDTFGNEGSMRVPVGSPFHPSNRLAGQKTGMTAQQTGSAGFGGGSNPFGQSTSSSAFGNNFNGQQQQQQQQQQDAQFFTI